MLASEAESGSPSPDPDRQRQPVNRPLHRFWFVLAVGIHHHGHLTAGRQ